MEVNKRKYFELLDLRENKNNQRLNYVPNNYNLPPLKDLAIISSKSSKKLISPQKLFSSKEEYYNNYQKISEGIYYDNSKKTKNGGIIRILLVDTSKVNMKAEFNQGKSINSIQFINNKNFIASINGQFFANGILLGDIKSNDKIYTDKNNYDKISDKRYFISIDDKGNISSGKGGLEENINEKTNFFIGGLLRLYDENKIYKDSYSGDSQHSSIARTFIGIDINNKLALITIGEGSKRNKGASFDESIKILKDLNIRKAFILDGGGSTNIIVKNIESTKTDGRNVNSYISVYKK